MNQTAIFVAVIWILGIFQFGKSPGLVVEKDEPGGSTVRITCMGNSITQGKVDKKTEPDSIVEMSYRYRLWEMLDSAGYDIDFTGYWERWFTENRESDVEEPRSAYTARIFDRDHDAYYGIRTGGFLNGAEGWPDGRIPPLIERIRDSESGYNTDVALIHLGTNDPDSIVDESVDNLKRIIEVIRQENEDVTIVLARLITPWKAVNKRMDEIAASMHRADSPVLIVDLSDGFINDPSKDGAMTFDWVHPNEKGQEFMAARWFHVLENAVLGDNILRPQRVEYIQEGDNIAVRWKVNEAMNTPGCYNIYVEGAKLNDILIEEPEFVMPLSDLEDKDHLTVSAVYPGQYITLYSDPIEIMINGN